MRKPEFYSAVYLIIKDNDWKILFGRRKWNFKNWYFQIIPAWHLEWEETYFDSAIREAKEELWVNVKKEDLKIIHICHRIMKGEIVYFDIYIKAKKYYWEIKICEKEKCSEIWFFDIENLPDDKFVSYDIDAIKNAYSWDNFSEIIYNW